MSWTKLVSEIVTSSIWEEDNTTLRVWIAILATKDKNGMVQGCLRGLARVCNVTPEECAAALAKLEGPDPDSRTKENEGRRLQKIDGGWVVLNHFKYRNSPVGQDAVNAAYKQKALVREIKEEIPGMAPLPKQKPSEPDQSPEELSALESDFNAFWRVYPKKQNKPDAFKAWIQTKLVRPSIDKIVQSVVDHKTYDRQWNRDNGDYVPMPATFIRGERWLDEYEKVEHVNRTPVQPAIEYTPDFDTLWDIYPVQGRVGKLDAWNEWNAALPRIMQVANGDLKALVIRRGRALLELAKTPKWTDQGGKYIPKIASWIRDGGMEE